jgi:hypothetical protein
MSEKIERLSNGTFRPGQSGNAAGARRRKRADLMTREDFDRMVIEIAMTETEISFGGKKRVMTYVQANLHQLATGRSGNRLTAKDFLEITRASIATNDHRERKREEERKRQEGPHH